MNKFKKFYRWILDTCKDIERLQCEMIEYQTLKNWRPRDEKGRFVRKNS